MNPYPLCRCCRKPTANMALRFDASLGFVCPICYHDLLNATDALSEAGYLGMVADPTEEPLAEPEPEPTPELP